jgi:hypothetical protein
MWFLQSVRHQGYPSPCLELSKALKLREVMKQPMTVDDVENLDAVTIKLRCNPTETGQHADKNGILLLRLKELIGEMNGVDGIAQLKECIEDLKRFPIARMLVGNGFIRRALKRAQRVRDTNVTAR